MPPKAKDAFTNSRDAFKKQALYLLTTFQLFEQYGERIKSLGNYLRAGEAMWVESTRR